MIENARPFGEPEEDRNGKAEAILRFDVPVEVDGHVWRAVMTVKLMHNMHRYYDHKMTKFEEVDTEAHSGGVSSASPNRRRNTTPGTSDGQALFSVAPSTDSQAFRDWFGESKVVDADGNPLVVYHGTNQSFNEFDNAKTGTNDLGLWGKGHYLSAVVRGPNSYALRQGNGANVIPAYVSIKNPLLLETGEDLITRLPDGTNFKDLIGPNLDGSKIKKIAEENGNDGVIQLKPDGLIGDIVAFSPTQIKSVYNQGTYDPHNVYIEGPAALLDMEVPEGARNRLKNVVYKDDESGDMESYEVKTSENT